MKLYQITTQIKDSEKENFFLAKLICFIKANNFNQLYHFFEKNKHEIFQKNGKNMFKEIKIKEKYFFPNESKIDFLERTFGTNAHASFYENNEELLNNNYMHYSVIEQEYNEENLLPIIGTKHFIDLTNE